MAYVFNAVTADNSVVEGFNHFLSVLSRLEGHHLNSFGCPADLFSYNYILAYIDKSPCQVTRVGCSECRVSQTFSRSGSRYEVFQNRKSFTEIRFDWNLDNLSGRICHKTPHSGQLSDLVSASPRPGMRHYLYVVHFAKILHESLCDILSGAFPCFYNLGITLIV